MLRFRNTRPGPSRIKPPPDYRSRQVQSRLLTLVFALGLAVMLIAEARKPQRWQWLWNLDRPPADSTSGQPGMADRDDTLPSLEAADSEPIARAWPGTVPIIPSAPPAEETLGPAATTPAPQDLVKDDTVFRAQEMPFWFLLAQRLLEDATVQQQLPAAPEVSYLQLSKQPAEYRGRLVSVRGTARMGYRLRAPRNELGIEQYHVVVLQPADGAMGPIIVYSLLPPPQLPPLPDRDLDRRTLQLRQEVVARGYFFKRWAYEARQGIQVAPLLLTRTLDAGARPTTNARDPLPSLVQLLAGLCLACGCAGLVTWFAWRQTRHGSRAAGHRSQEFAIPPWKPLLPADFEAAGQQAPTSAPSDTAQPQARQGREGD